MFTRTASFYDAIYEWKNYAKEADRLREFIAEHCRSGGRALLDVAIGTGGHVPRLREFFDVDGLDFDRHMLDIVGAKYPGLTLHHADMVDFRLDHRFDVVVCLFSSIGYARTEVRLRDAVRSMGGHLKPGGVLIIEPWLYPETYKAGVLHANFVDKPDLKVARMNVSRVDGGVAVLEFRYLVGRPEGIETFEERHELGLFTHEQYLDAIDRAELDPVFDAEGLTGRGLYLGKSRTQP